MAGSTQSVVSDGTLAVLDISIDYSNRSEISVLFNGTALGIWTWLGTTEKRIQFNNPIQAGTEVTIIRSTNTDTLKNVFSAGAAFTAKALDEDFTQTLRAAREALDCTRTGNFYTKLNMHGKAITNLANGVSNTDAITVQQHKQDVDGLVSSVGSLVSGVNNLTSTKVDKVAGKQLSTLDYTQQDKTKLDGIEVGATKNSTDAELRERVNHTGVQGMETITGLQEALQGLTTTTFLDGGNASSLYTPYQLITGGSA